MGTINQLRAKLQSLNIAEVSQASIEETKDEIIERQKEQLRYGLNSKGEKIGKYKNPAYARKKSSMNPLAGFGNVDLKLTGAFVGGIKVDVGNEVFTTESLDSKAEGLEAKYGNDILGLDEDHKKGYVKNLRPVFLKKVRSKTGL